MVVGPTTDQAAAGADIATRKTPHQRMGSPAQHLRTGPVLSVRKDEPARHQEMAVQCRRGRSGRAGPQHVHATWTRKETPCGSAWPS